MTDRVRPVPSPARFGLTEQHAERLLRAAGWWGVDGPPVAVEPVLAALSRSADPDLALRAIDRLRTALGARWPELATALRDDVELRGRLFAVLGASSALGDFLVAHPEQWPRLASHRPPDTADTPNTPDTPDTPNTADTADTVDGLTARLLRAVGADPSAPPPGTPHGARATLPEQEAIDALRTTYRALLLDIAAADLAPVVQAQLSAPTYDDVAGRLSDLAVAALRASLAVAAAEVGQDGVPLECSLAVIAMGKCGARELNYVSDVDVVFAVDREEELPAATRLASTMMRVAGKACFDVDAALRPEGRVGALVRTLEGHASYYRRWARTWEFQALLKARPVAGDIELGHRYVGVVAPLVWTAADRTDFVVDVQTMRRRVVENVPPGVAERELKLGRGGLRDVEFAVQLLQLVHGRADESLRIAATVDALAALGRGGYVGRLDAAQLGDSYRFLRLLEHRVQLQRLRRTHLFPATGDSAGLRWLARAAGWRPDGRRGAEDVLLADFRHHVNRVLRLHEKLFYRPLLDAVAKVPTEALRLTAKEAAARLAALGYASPEGALHHIQALTAGVTRRAAIQGALLPVLLDLFAGTPDPDGGLLAYRRVSEAHAETPWYLRLLRDEGAVAQRLATLLGTSRLVPDLLVRAPEALRLLADTNAIANTDPADVATALHSAVTRHTEPTEAATAARSMRRHELFRIASADLLGLLEPTQVCRSLSSVWIAVLQAVLDVAQRAIAAQWGGTFARIAVIGMGRLGGAELGYGSDADVLFVCEPCEPAEPAGSAEESTAVRFGSAVAELVRGLLGSPSQDPPLQVDADLRPEGRNGPLVRTLDSYRAYYAQWAQVWEAQALLRARFVAGDAELGHRFLAMVDPVRYPEGGLDAARVVQIRRIKARVDTERLPRGADPATHTKLGTGGLADIEWTLQLLQLRHGHRIPELRTTSTVAGLAAASAAGLLAAEDAAALTDAWTLVTRARNAAMLVKGKPVDQLPRRGRELVAVARALGYPAGNDPGEFIDDYRRATRRARAVVERVFYGP